MEQASSVSCGFDARVVTIVNDATRDHQRFLNGSLRQILEHDVLGQMDPYSSYCEEVIFMNFFLYNSIRVGFPFH